MLPPNLTRARRFITWALRHQPAAAQVHLDPHGWASVDAMIRSLRQHGHRITTELPEIVASDSEGRFSLSSDGRFIRANSGHTIAIDLGLAPSKPPMLLYHATAHDNLPQIKREGLRRQTDRFVPLVDTIDPAIQQGSIITVYSLAMFNDGLALYYDERRNAWLTEDVPVDYLQFET